MPTNITSAQVAAFYGLSSASATELSLTSRLEEALGCLQTLEAYHAQGWAELPGALRQEASERAFAALRAVPQIVSREDLIALETSAIDPSRFSAETSKLRSGLAVQWNAVRQMEEQAQSDQLLMMTRIVSGGQPYAGLPDVRSIVAYHQIPDWARRVAYRNGEEKHLELNAHGEGLFQPEGQESGVALAFQFGRHWVRDLRDASLLDVRNLFRSGGVFVGSDASPLRLKPGVLWPVTPGGSVRVGKKAGVTLRMPTAPALEALRAAIAVTPTLEELSRLLKAAGLDRVAAQVDRFLKDRTPFENLPTDGGLSLKVAELALKAEFRRLHHHYMPQMDENMAGQVFRSLALVIDQAQSSDDLVRAVKTSMLPGALALAEGIALFVKKPTKASVAKMTTDFGLRERAIFVSKQAAAQLEKTASALQRRVDELTQELDTTTAQLAAKTAALAAAEEAARQEAARLAKEKEEREAREAREREERAAQEAARRKADQEKDERHQRERREQTDRHFHEMETLEERFESENEALEQAKRRAEQQMETLEGARAALQKEKENAEAAVGRLMTEIGEAKKETLRLDAALTEAAQLAGEAARKAFKENERRQMAFEELKRDHLDLVEEKMRVDEALRLANEALDQVRPKLEEAERRVGELNAQLEEERSTNARNLETERSERAGVEAKFTELTAKAGRAESLQGELEGANVEIRRLEALVKRLQGGDRSSAVETLEDADLEPIEDGEDTAVIRLPKSFVDRFFDVGDPRLAKVEVAINDERKITDADGHETFNARIIAGGESGSVRYRFADGSLISGKTSRGGRNYQQDGIYASWFTLPDGTVVKILAGSDGAGGHGGGEVVSSAFLQGVHARIAEAAQEGRIPTAAELFQEGFRATLVQRKHPDRNQDEDPNKHAANGTGTGAIVVIVGNMAMIATAGDAMVVHARKTEDGHYKTMGYSDVQSLAAAGQGNVITSGVHLNDAKLYIARDLKPGDRFFFGSDGEHENVLGAQYKVVGANLGMLRNNLKKPHPTQETFRPLNLALEATEGREDAGDVLHDLAQFNIDGPGRAVDLNGRRIQLPEKKDKDNIFSMNYEHGTAQDVELSMPGFHKNPLEAVALSVSRDLALQKQQSQKNVAIGSDPACDLFVPGASLDLHHAAVGFNPGENCWYILDSGTLNGTSINGQALLPRQWMPLPHDAVLWLGQTPFSVYLADDGSLQFVPLSPEKAKVQAPPQAPQQKPFPSPPPPPPPPPPSGAAEVEKTDGGHIVYLNGMKTLNVVTAALLSTLEKLEPTPGGDSSAVDFLVDSSVRGRMELVSAQRSGTWFRVESKHPKLRVEARFPDQPQVPVKIEAGTPVDVPDNTIIQIQGKYTLIVRSQRVS